MSQIGSTSGVRVAAQPLSNVYTVLLLVAALTLLVAAVKLGVYMNSQFDTVLGGQEALDAVGAAARTQSAAQAELDEKQEAIKRFPEGAAAAPAAGTETAPAPDQGMTPAPETPAPTPEAPAGPAPDAGTTPAPAEPAAAAPAV
jgi:hypothetical protein